MPSIELYNPDAHPDGWHDVRAPGGYEWWYFDAEDAASDTQVVAIFMEGFIFHPGYLRAHNRFMKRPTRVQPPLAADYPCVYLCVYRAGRVWKQFFSQYQRGYFHASRDGCDVRISEHCYARETEHGYELALAGTPWHLTPRGPVRSKTQSLSARLQFRRSARFSPIQRPFLSQKLSGATHHWTIAAPRCDVAGTIETTSTDLTGNTERIDFAGVGYHDHNFGTAPIGQGLSRWTWGRAMFSGDRVVTFHHVEPKQSCDAHETHLVEITPQRMHEHVAMNVIEDWSGICNSALRLRYPLLLDFGSALRLSEPRIIDPSPFYLRLAMQAESHGERSTAFCEIAYPHRARWPILGRMIEMSFDTSPVR